MVQSYCPLPITFTSPTWHPRPKRWLKRVTDLEGDRTETVLGATASFLPAKELPAKPDTAMVADAAAIANVGDVTSDAVIDQNVCAWRLGNEIGAVCVCMGLWVACRFDCWSEDKGSEVWRPLAGLPWVQANKQGLAWIGAFMTGCLGFLFLISGFSAFFSQFFLEVAP